MGEMGHQVFYCLFASMDGGFRRIRDKGGGVESRTLFKGELRGFEKGNMN